MTETQEREKSSKTVFKERTNNWNNEEKRHHLELLEQKLYDDEKQYDIQELGLRLFLENPYPLQPQYEYERNENYVRLKVELQEEITNKKLKEQADEIEYTRWKIKHLKRQLGEKDE